QLRDFASNILWSRTYPVSNSDIYDILTISILHHLLRHLILARLLPRANQHLAPDKRLRQLFEAVEVQLDRLAFGRLRRQPGTDSLPLDFPEADLGRSLAAVRF